MKFGKEVRSTPTGNQAKTEMRDPQVNRKGRGTQIKTQERTKEKRERGWGRKEIGKREAEKIRLKKIQGENHERKAALKTCA